MFEAKHCPICGIDPVREWTTLHTNGWILDARLDFKREG